MVVAHSQGDGGQWDSSPSWKNKPSSPPESSLPPITATQLLTISKDKFSFQKILPAQKYSTSIIHKQPKLETGYVSDMKKP